MENTAKNATAEEITFSTLLGKEKKLKLFHLLGKSPKEILNTRKKSRHYCQGEANYLPRVAPVGDGTRGADGASQESHLPEAPGATHYHLAPPAAVPHRRAICWRTSATHYHLAPPATVPHRRAICRRTSATHYRLAPRWMLMIHIR